MSQTHPIGRFKSVVFIELGYQSRHWDALQADLKAFLLLDALFKVDTKYGKKYEICGNITGPNGKTIPIVTAWIILNGDDFPKFITAYPGD